MYIRLYLDRAVFGISNLYTKEGVTLFIDRVVIVILIQDVIFTTLSTPKFLESCVGSKITSVLYKN